MKRSAMRLLALLSAVMLLTGVFAVHAEEYAEYSGGLSVADARAATGYDTDVYICVDGVWRDIGDARSFEETIEFDLGWTSFNYDYDVLSVSDLPGSLSDFGYTGHSAADTFFPVTINNGSVASSERKSDWPRDDLIPLGTYGPENMGYDNGEAFGVYYAPNFEVDWNVYNVSASLTELAEDNSFCTISVQGLTDAALATVDYGTAHDTDFGHVVLTGDTATVTVPNEGYAWRYTGGYDSVTINEQATTTTYTFDNVTGPLTLTAETSAVNVTVQTLDMEGNVAGSQVYEVASGGRLPAEALVTPADYAWYNVLGQQISSNNVAAMTFDAATTLTLAPKGYYGTDHAVHFYIYVKNGDSGAWREVHTSDVLYGPVSDSRYAVTAEQLEAAFGAYGFSSDDAWSSIEPRLAQNGKDNDTIWGDTHIVTFGDSWAYPLGHTSGSTRVYAVYYLPQNETALNGGTNRHQLGQNNAFRDVTLTEESTGATVTYTLNETTNLAQWLKTIAAEKPEGWERPVGAYKWIPTNAGQTFDATSTPETLQALTGTEPFVTVTLLDEDGNAIDVIEDVERGTSIAKWLEDNDGLQLADGTTLHEYKWTLLHDLSITTQVFDEDKTLVGKKKPLYTITFVDQNPDGSEDGGDFINGSESYTTIQVLEGDSIPESFVARMQANLRLHEGWAFDHWDISLDTGILPWHPEVLISSDAVVWPHYTQNVHVYFWKDRTKTERFPETGMEKQPVGSLYQGAAPDADAVMAEAPVDDMRFRYWYDLNSGEIFDLATDKVLNALDLYPVFERAIYAFNDAATGTPLAVLYDGSPMNHEPEDRAGYYYAGLQVTCADGTTHVIPNGTPVTREYLTANNIPIPEKVNGRYNIPATPLYKQQRTVVYHTGDDAQFIIYGAEQQQEYTVTVDDELVLLGALDIINVTSPIGLALAGWTSDPDATGADDVMFIPNQSFEGDDALDELVEAGGTVHLYPIWAPQENTIPINFVSQYPADAVDQNGNALQPRTYTVYIQKGARPTMPTLNKAGFQAPANQYADESRYVFAGWSRDEDGKLTSTDKVYTQTYGTYTAGSEYLFDLTEGTTFYAIWVDRQPVEGVQAFFFIHLDGTIPVEPNQYTTAGYIGNCGTAYNNGWVGRVNKPLNVVNNVPEVEANVLEEPDEEFLYNQLTALEGNTYFPEADLEKLRALSPSDYGTRWWIDWYACKLSCGSPGHYHVDGRLRFATDLQLTYHANGGVNPPPASRHEQYEQVTPDWSVRPERQNFTFLGWDTSPDAKIPTYPVPGTTYPSGPNESQIWMDTDKILYAVWKPDATTIPMSDKFKGIKYEQTNNGPETAPAAGHRYQFTIEAITLPEGSAPYETQTATSQTDGSFSFPQIQVTVPGLYVFEVREVIGDLPVQYDASVYRLTVNIVESDYGLGIAGYSFTRNNRIVTVDGNNLDNMVFEFVNRTGIRDVTATKVWDDGENQDGLRPASVDVHIYRRGDGIWSDSATLTAANNWSWTWEGLEIMNSGSGEIYEYYIVEDAVPQYTTTYSGDMNAGLVVTNRYVPRTADFPVEKLWQDDDDAAGIRPETLTYILTGSTPDGTVVSTTVSDPVTDPWRYTFEDMPLYNSGQHLLYTLSEVAIPGYDTTIATIGSSDGGQDYRVTNTLAVTHVTVTKQISGNVANDTEVFPFTAWVYDANGLLLTDIGAGEGYTVGDDGAIRFTLGHADSVELRMLPLGGTIVLTEESGTYTATYAPEGTQTSSGMRYDLTQGLAITVTNTRDATVDTGVTLDTVPYLLLLGLALMHLAGLVIKRRVA